MRTHMYTLTNTPILTHARTRNCTLFPDCDFSIQLLHEPAEPKVAKKSGEKKGKAGGRKGTSKSPTAAPSNGKTACVHVRVCVFARLNSNYK
jgi:hypothetical protein